MVIGANKANTHDSLTRGTVQQGKLHEQAVDNDHIVKTSYDVDNGNEQSPQSERERERERDRGFSAAVLDSLSSTGVDAVTGPSARDWQASASRDLVPVE